MCAMLLLSMLLHCSYDPDALALLDLLLTLNPRQRVDASTALDHKYFFSKPALLPPEQVLPRLNFGSCHEYEAKERSKKLLQSIVAEA
eukprot:16287-Heterococcus_DN1.PRE.2